jgi:hypothetical protein
MRLNDIQTYTTIGSDAFAAGEELEKHGVKDGDVFVWKNPGDHRFYAALLTVIENPESDDGTHINLMVGPNDSFGKCINEFGFKNELDAKKCVFEELNY